MKLTPIKVPDNKFLEQIGFFWHTDPDQTPYIASEIVDLVQELEVECMLNVRTSYLINSLR